MCINHNHHTMCLRFNIRPLSYMSGATNPAGLNFYKQTKLRHIYIDNGNQQGNKKCFEVSFNSTRPEQPYLERNTKLRGLKAGEDLSCLIKLTQYMIAFLNCAWKWRAKQTFLWTCYEHWMPANSQMSPVYSKRLFLTRKCGVCWFCENRWDT